MLINTYTFHYQPDIDDAYSFPVAVMAFNSKAGEITITALDPDHPAAPWQHDEVVVEHIEDIINGFVESAEKRMHIASLLRDGYPVDPYGLDGIEEGYPVGTLTLTANPPLVAEDTRQAVDLMMDGFVLPSLGYYPEMYETFTVDYRPNEEEHYPLIVCTYDEENGRLTGRTLGDLNPFLPRLSRQQRRQIAREMGKFLSKIQRGDAQAALEGLDRPRFGVFKLDHHRAMTPEEALDWAEETLWDLYADKVDVDDFIDEEKAS